MIIDKCLDVFFHYTFFILQMNWRTSCQLPRDSRNQPQDPEEGLESRMVTVYIDVQSYDMMSDVWEPSVDQCACLFIYLFVLFMLSELQGDINSCKKKRKKIGTSFLFGPRNLLFPCHTSSVSWRTKTVPQKASQAAKEPCRAHWLLSLCINLITVLVLRLIDVWNG